MEALDLVRRLHQHRSCVNDNLLSAAEHLSDEQLRATFAMGQGSIWKSLLHLYAAEYVWLEALRGNDHAVAPGDLPGMLPGNQQGNNPIAKLEDLRQQWTALERQWAGYLSALTPAALDESVDKVSSSEGTRFRTRTSDVLLHVCLHAHYTTAQVVNMLRHAGVEKLPAVMLMALARREGAQSIAAVPLPDRNTFESAYAGQAPWDIGRPQQALIDVADQIKGSILDAGCGTGENALFFAARGHKVTGIDFLAEPIKRAKLKAADRLLPATLLVMDALALEQLPEVFDTVIDSGLFHVFSDEDRRRYVAGLASALKPGGRLFLLCFSDQEPGSQGPRRMSRPEIEEAFAQGWHVESVEPTRFEVRPDLKDLTFSAGGPKAWFAVVRRK